MRKLIFTAMILGLSFNLQAGQIGESQMAECTESVQSPRSQESVAVVESAAQSDSQETSASER